MKEILSSIPQVSEWLDLLTSAGYDVLLTDTNAQATLFVPVNSAFSAGIDAEPLRKEKTMQELISNAPDVRTPLAGYSGKI
jgi:DNA anti-recombination protein RmuC